MAAEHVQCRHQSVVKRSFTTTHRSNDVPQFPQAWSLPSSIAEEVNRMLGPLCLLCQGRRTCMRFAASSLASGLPNCQAAGGLGACRVKRSVDNLG